MAMDYTKYTAARNTFVTNPGLCSLFKLLSIETWKRIEYAYLKPRMKVFETTITQNIVFTINAFNDIYGLNIDIYEALNERANGNDLELIIRYPAEGVEYYAPIQAKKLYKNGKKYSSMDHGDQIESLINYARRKNAKPFYLLYNYAMPPVKRPSRFDPNIELYGCTMIEAQHLFDNYYQKRRVRKRDGSIEMKWKIPNFYHLNPAPAFPWHVLVCADGANGLQQKLTDLKIVPTLPPSDGKTMDLVLAREFNAGFFKIGTHEPDDRWINVREIEPRMGQSKEFKRLIEKDDFKAIKEYEEFSDKKEPGKQRVYPDFSPKSRIVLTKES